MDHHHHLPPPLTTASASTASWACIGQESSAEELRQALLYTTLELESTRVAAQEELGRMEDQTIHLTHLLDRTTRERDDARHQTHSLLLLLMDNHHLPTNPNPNPNPTPEPPVQPFFVDEAAKSTSSDNHNFLLPATSSSSSESSMSSSPHRRWEIEPVGELPEKGKLLEAVLKAGPLLQTLLLAGPLPQWRHPPPPLQSFEIPPVAINIKNGREREREGDAVMGWGGQEGLSPATTPLSSSSSPESNNSSMYQRN